AAGEFTGRFSDDRSTIDGSWAQGGASMPLLLARTDAESLAPNRPQEPQPPFPYEALDVEFDNLEAGIRLAGTLTIPGGDGPHPAVTLLTGSGPQDRDETVFGHRPFLVLADYLTRHGIAVLRFDDRGIGASTGDFAVATTSDFASDALAAVAFLKTRPDVDPEKIGLVGHSEGAIVAPMAANRGGDVAFAVLLASTGVNGRELLVMQAKAMNRAAGLPETVIEQRAEVQESLLDVVADAESDSVAAERARVILADAGLTGDAAEGQIRSLLSPWMKYFLTYDPLPELRELSIPVLALNGEKDTQVPPTENLLPVEEALREGGNPDVTAEVLPGLNHLFQTAETGVPAEYAGIEETFSPAALEKIAAWILERT
ncbi:MAG: alpha/beta fold hydrolase, partial [Gemmatimonadales bacterium]